MRLFLEEHTKVVNFHGIQFIVDEKDSYYHYMCADSDGDVHAYLYQPILRTTRTGDFTFWHDSGPRIYVGKIVFDEDEDFRNTLIEI